jgi:hypothetical protein
MADGQRAVSTGTLNTPGRMGSVDSEIYLCNAAVVAASAIEGRIAAEGHGVPAEPPDHGHRNPRRLARRDQRIRLVRGHQIPRLILAEQEPRLAALQRHADPRTFVLGEDAPAFVTEFVRIVMEGEDNVAAIHKSMAHAALTKGFYGHEWLSQFKGTELFDEAVKLCEEEIEREQKRIKKQLEDAKRRKKIESRLATSPSDWDNSYAADSQLRLKKDQLQIKLAKMQQKMLTTRKSAD